jgi:hypothetical protein
MKKWMCVVACLVASPLALLAQGQGSNGQDNAGGGVRYIEAGQPAVVVHGTVEQAQQASKNRPVRSSNLAYQGGVSDGGAGTIGVETAPKVYLVLWGSQWNNNDPSGEVSILQSFYSKVGGSSWNASVTQYCQGLPAGTIFCNGGGTPAGNNVVFGGTWADNASAAPSAPTQSQLAAEAIRAAGHFGNGSSPSTNATVQYVIATATGNNASGFGTQYCAWHSSTSSSSTGAIAYTNLPYMTDAGASCGANFNGLGPTAGITIVGGHEMAETESDQFPNGGWLDSRGSENGDKCAWISSGQGASSSVSLNGTLFPVQSLWSNAFNGGAGGCVLSYP